VISKTLIKSTFDSLKRLNLGDCLLDGCHISRTIAATLITQDNIWNFKVATSDLELALKLGSGWVSVLNDINELKDHSLRLIDTPEKVIGFRLDKLNNNTFNLYFNECNYCRGSGSVVSWEDNLFNKSKNILDVGFYPEFLKSDIKKILFRLKESLIAFQSEDLIDTRKNFESFSLREKNSFLHGIPNYTILKKGGRKTAKEDNIIWMGIYNFLLQNKNKLSKKATIILDDSLQNECCHFCKGTKYSKQFNYYRMNGNRIWE
jgi:excinuclease UvrABC ATPase subunit